MRSVEADAAVRALSSGPGGIAYRAVAADAWFSVRVARHLEATGEVGGVLPSVVGSWWSMYLHEGRAVLRQRAPGLVTPMSADAVRTFERSRHGLKMFLDTQRDVSEYESYFEQIEAAHRAHFIGSVARPVRWVGRDLGVNLYQGRVISTTHGFAFSSGLEPEALLNNNMGERLLRLWTEGGGAFAMAALAVDGPKPMVAERWDPSEFVSRDRVSRSFYRSIFTGEARPHLNAVLLHYLGMLNAADMLFPRMFSEADDAYVLFKMRYVAVAHVLGSLRKLLKTGGLPDSTNDLLNAIIDGLPHSQAASRSWLRNLLVHYEPNARSDPSKVSGLDLLTDVLALSEVPETRSQIEYATDENLAYLAGGLETWMGRSAIK